MAASRFLVPIPAIATNYRRPDTSRNICTNGALT